MLQTVKYIQVISFFGIVILVRKSNNLLGITLFVIVYERGVPKDSQRKAHQRRLLPPGIRNILHNRLHLYEYLHKKKKTHK